MDVANLIFIIVALAYIGAITYLANVVEVSRGQKIKAAQLRDTPIFTQEPQEARILRWLLYGWWQ
jgi:hypothetical protein